MAHSPSSNHIDNGLAAKLQRACCLAHVHSPRVSANIGRQQALYNFGLLYACIDPYLIVRFAIHEDSLEKKKMHRHKSRAYLHTSLGISFLSAHIAIHCICCFGCLTANDLTHHRPAPFFNIIFLFFLHGIRNHPKAWRATAWAANAQRRA